jgi:AcrR family transcriptional regulator
VSRPPGRPRSEASRKAILDASLSLAASRGYGAVTIDGIAAEAGVGKQTIYRWWSSRAAVMLSAIREVASLHIHDPDTGDFERDLVGFLADTYEIQRRVPAIVPLLRGLMAEAQLSPVFLDELLTELIEPRRRALRAIFERAQARGEIDEREIETGIDLAFGLLWYRLITGRLALDRRAAARVARTIARGSRATSASRSTS